MGAQEVNSYRVILDTNCIISALVFKGIVSTKFRRLWQAGTIVPIVCPETKSEFLKVLEYDKFALSKQTQKELATNFLSCAEDFPSINPIANIKELIDPKDAVFIRLAQKSNSDFLVSGDKHIFMLNELFPELHILRPSQFLEIIYG